MAITGPYYVSASALPREYITLRVGSEVYVIVNKSHQGLGFPRRELEFFPFTDLITPVPPIAYPVYPLRVEILQESFSVLSAVWIGGTIIRLYFTQTFSVENSTLYQVEVDLANRRASSPVSVLSFTGTDPWIMDGRTPTQPMRLYLLTVNRDGSNVGRHSDDFGTTWSDPAVFDIPGSNIRQMEANFTDPPVLLNVQILQQRDP